MLSLLSINILDAFLFISLAVWETPQISCNMEAGRELKTAQNVYIFIIKMRNGDEIKLFLNMYLVTVGNAVHIGLGICLRIECE